MLFSNKEPGRKDLADAVCGSLFAFLEMGLKEKSLLKKYLPSSVDIYGGNSETDEDEEFEDFIKQDYMSPEEREDLINRFKRN